MKHNIKLVKLLQNVLANGVKQNKASSINTDSVNFEPLFPALLNLKFLSHESRYFCGHIRKTM